MRFKTLLRSFMVIITVAAAAVTVPATAAWAITQGPYLLKPRGGLNLCAQPRGEVLANLTVVELVACRDVGAQKWYFRDSESLGPYYKLIVNGASHTCLNVRNAGGVGTPLVIYGCSDTTTRRNDMFITNREGSDGVRDYYFLTEQAHEKCVSFGSLTHGSDLFTAEPSAARNCAWTWVATNR